MNEIQKITLTVIGTPKTVKGQKGDFQTIGIKCAEIPDTWMNGYYNQITKNWKVGDVVDVVITDKIVNGNTFKNFSLPKEDNAIGSRILKLEKRVMTLELAQDRIKAEIKSELMLELKSKVQTSKDFETYSQPHPLVATNPEDEYFDNANF